MFAKQLVIFAVLLLTVVAFVSCSPGVSNKEKYGEISLDKDGFNKFCLTTAVVFHESYRYSHEKVAKELKTDMLALSVRAYNFERAGFEGCALECSMELLPKLNDVPDFGRRKLIDSQCFEHKRLQRLWAKLGDLQSKDSLVLAKRNWIRETNRRLIPIMDSISSWASCSDDITRAAYAEAERVLPEFLGMTKNQFEEEKSALINKLNNLEKQLEDHDNKIREEAYARISEEIAELLPKYEQCFLEKAAKSAGKTNKGLLRKIFH